MKDRIRMIMESENYTPARFADTLDIGRAIVSHILNGRNNPSLDVISRILEAFPSVNPDWLLFGTGEMYRTGTNTTNQNTEINTLDQTTSNSVSDKRGLDLFSQPEDLFASKVQSVISPEPVIEEKVISKSVGLDKERISKEENVSSPDTGNIETVVEKIVYKDLPARKISQIIIYYDDNTFEVFNR